MLGARIRPRLSERKSPMEEDTDNPVTFDAHAKTINAAVSAVLIYKARSTRLATRLIKVIDHIPKKSSASDLHITTNINLLSVTKDDILAYYKLISETSPELVSHLLKYGSDEECFYKWNERLRLISIIFNVPGISTVFDTKVDRQDLRDDVVHLHENTGFVTKVTAEKDGIKALLSNQETKAYKTVQNVDIGIVIKAKMIRYDRVLGKGILTILIKRCIWRSVEGKN